MQNMLCKTNTNMKKKENILVREIRLTIYPLKRVFSAKYHKITPRSQRGRGASDDTYASATFYSLFTCRKAMKRVNCAEE